MGPAVRPSPYLQPRGGRAPIKAAGRYRPGPPLPHHQTLAIKCSEAPPSLPLFKRPLPLLNLPPPLISIKAAWPLMAMPPGAASRPLLSLFKRP
jgi:hypothetical protein